MLSYFPRDVLDEILIESVSEGFPTYSFIWNSIQICSIFLIDCPGLTAPTDGSLSSSAVSVGTSVDVLCNSGLSLFGTTPLICETGGTWADAVGICKQGKVSLRLENIFIHQRKF